MLSQRQQLSLALIRVMLENSVIAKMLSVVLKEKGAVVTTCSGRGHHLSFSFYLLLFHGVRWNSSV